MSICQCPACSITVMPRPDGSCPSCGAAIDEPRPPSETAERPSSAPTVSSAVTEPADAPDVSSESVQLSDLERDASSIVVLPNRFMSVMMMLLSGGLLALGLIAVLNRDEVPGKFVALGVAFLVIMPVLFVFSLRKLFSQDPVLVAGSQGLWDNASLACVGLIRWSEIRELYSFREEGIRFLAIDVRNPDDVLKRRRGVQGAFARFEQGADGSAPLRIPQTFLSVSIDELLTQISKRFDVAVRTES